MATVQWLNRAKRIAKLRAIPAPIRAAAGKQLTIEVDGLVAAQKRAAPINSDLQETPGSLRDSIHKYKTPGRPLSYRIIADDRDPETGNFIGPHVEAGHKARDGSHVPRQPFFFPTYRARKKAMRRRLQAAARKAAKTEFERG